MSTSFKFFRNRRNVEIFRVNIHDPLNGDSTLTSSEFDKIEVVFSGGVNVVISSDTNEITWNNDVIQIKPSIENLLALPDRTHFELIAYKGAEDVLLLTGIFYVTEFL